LDPAARDASSVAARCGSLRTRGVAVRTTLVVARFRLHLKPTIPGALTLLCEEIIPLALQGTAASLQWIDGDHAEAQLTARPDANIPSSLVDQQLPLLLGDLADLQPALAAVADGRAPKDHHLRSRRPRQRGLAAQDRQGWARHSLRPV